MAAYLLLTILLGLFGLIYHLYVQYSRKGRLVNQIPGPTAVPILGSILSLHVPLERVNELLREWGKKYYPVYKTWFLSTPLIHIRHPDDLEIMLTNTIQINKVFAYEQFDEWLKTGLLTSWASKWHGRRKILTPAFHFNILKKYMDITNEEGEKAIANLKTLGKESVQSLMPFCSKYTLNIICESAMGVALDDVSDKAMMLKYKEAVYKMGKFIVYRAIRPYIKNWMLPFMPKFNSERKKVLKNLNDFTDKIVKERREYHKNTDYKYLEELNKSETEFDNIYTGKRKRLAMLDLLLSAERENLIDDEGIKEEVATFIFEGHDTTAMGMCFAIMLLAENKNAQSLARKEVEDILLQKGGKLDTTDLQEMKYLERCIKETIRLFPSVPSVARHLTADIQLKNCTIPEGSEVLIHFIDVHRDSNFWPEPEKFDPDRFLPENIKDRHPFAYLPFSAGSRNCIGQKFAIMELKSLIARILYNFYLEPVDYIKNVKLVTDVVVRPSEPVHTRFIRIDR